MVKRHFRMRAVLDSYHPARQKQKIFGSESGSFNTPREKKKKKLGLVDYPSEGSFTNIAGSLRVN